MSSVDIYVSDLLGTANATSTLLPSLVGSLKSSESSVSGLLTVPSPVQEMFTTLKADVEQLKKQNTLQAPLVAKLEQDAIMASVHIEQFSVGAKNVLFIFLVVLLGVCLVINFASSANNATLHRRLDELQSRFDALHQNYVARFPIAEPLRLQYHYKVSDGESLVENRDVYYDMLAYVIGAIKKSDGNCVIQLIDRDVNIYKYGFLYLAAEKMSRYVDSTFHNATLYTENDNLFIAIKKLP